VTFKVKAANTGDLESGNARVCVKLPGAAKQALKAPSGAVGTYKLTFQPKGAPGKAAKAKVVVSG
jgi:hypothetical protein